MIFSHISVEQKKIINRVILGLGFIVLLLGFFTDFLSYRWGIVFFVFTLVVGGIVKIIIPEPDANQPDEIAESSVEKILKSGEKSGDQTEKQ